MDIKELLLAICIAILAVIMLVYYSKCKKKFSKLLFGTLSGVAVLYPIQILITSLGGILYVNLFSVCVSVILGIPGAVLLGIAALL